MKKIVSDYKDMILGQSKGPEQFITRSYLLALFIIGLMTMLTHGITTRITAAQQEATEINYNLSRQRANIQQVALYSKRYHSSNSIIDKEFLEQAIDEIENSYNFLFDNREKQKLKSPVLQEFFFEPPNNMDKNLTRFVEVAKELANPPITFSDEDIEQRIELIEEQATSRLVRSFDVVHEFYQEESARRIAKLFKLQSLSVLFIILVLVTEALYIFRPLVVKLSRYHQKLLKLALEDPLTGLNNRRAFITKATNELERSAADKKPASIVICDLDKFKSINDTYGHHVGDQVLKHFSRLMTSTLRAKDIIGRIGGEEFAILLPSCDKKEAHMIIDRFRETVANTPCGYDDDHNRKQTLSYTGSFGVIVSHNPEANIEMLLSAADKNLYDAKETGRNKVVVSVLVDLQNPNLEDEEIGQATAQNEENSEESPEENTVQTAAPEPEAEPEKPAEPTKPHLVHSKDDDDDDDDEEKKKA